MEPSPVKVLLDNCVPRPFAVLLVGHEVITAGKMGWADLKNGALLSAAGMKFAAFITVDRSLMHQQNRQDLPLPVILIRARDNKIESLAVWATDVIKLLGQDLQRRVYFVGLSD